MIKKKIDILLKMIINSKIKLKKYKIIQIQKNTMKQNKSAKLTLRTTKNLKRRLKNQSELNGITLSKYINNILKNF